VPLGPLRGCGTAAAAIEGLSLVPAENAAAMLDQLRLQADRFQAQAVALVFQSGSTLTGQHPPGACPFQRHLSNYSTFHADVRFWPITRRSSFVSRHIRKLAAVCGGATMILPGDTKTTLRGRTPRRSTGAALSLARSSRDNIGSVDPDALKMAARRAEYSLSEGALSPFRLQRTLDGASSAVPNADGRRARSGAAMRSEEEFR